MPQVCFLLTEGDAMRRFLSRWAITIFALVLVIATIALTPKYAMPWQKVTIAFLELLVLGILLK